MPRITEIIPEKISPIIVYNFNFLSLELGNILKIKSLPIVVPLKNKKLFRVDIIVAKRAA